MRLADLSMPLKRLPVICPSRAWSKPPVQLVVLITCDLVTVQQDIRDVFLLHIFCKACDRGASRILCKRTDVVQIEQIISRERSRVQGDRSLGVILAVEMPRVKDQPLNPASCRKRKLRVERGSRSSPAVCRSISL